MRWLVRYEEEVVENLVPQLIASITHTSDKIRLVIPRDRINRADHADRHRWSRKINDFAALLSYVLTYYVYIYLYDLPIYDRVSLTA